MQPEQYPVPAQPSPDGQPQPDADWLKNYKSPKASPPKQRILVIVAIVGVVLAVIFLFLTFIVGGEDIQSQVRKLAADQQDIVRLANIGQETDNASAPTHNLASTISIIGGSNVQALASVVGQLSKDELALAANTSADTRFQTAAQTNTFDTVFPDVMKTELTELNASLSSLFDQTNNQKLKEVLIMVYDNNKELITATTSVRN